MCRVSTMWMWVVLLAVVLSGTVLYAGPVRNVIFIVGDGMGPEQVKAGRYYLGRDFCFESFPYQADCTTGSANDSTTDSAAAASAMATGRKVSNRVVSIANPGDLSDLPSMLEYFKAKGKRTGLVSTAYMTHATPAGFGAHAASRDNLAEIASDYLYQTRPNVLFGGGANGLTPTSAEAAGYTVVENAAEFAALDTESAEMVSGQFGTGHFPFESEGIGDRPHLSDMTRTALRILDNDPDGFFVMIEGALIDYAGHHTNVFELVPEMAEFDNAVQEAIDWAVGRQDTLIVVSADHETGGLTVLADNGSNQVPTVAWSTTQHTSTPVPVYAWGPLADQFTGTIDNTNFFAMVTADVLLPPACVEIRDQAPAGISTSWLVVSGGVYRLECSPAIWPSASWSPLAVITSMTGQVSLMDETASEVRERYCRLVAEE